LSPVDTAAPAEHVTAVGQLGPGRGTLVVSLEPGVRGKLTKGAPLTLEARGDHLHFPERRREKLDPAKLPLRIPIDVEDGATGPAFLKLSYYWCGDTAKEPEPAPKLAQVGDVPGSCRLESANLVVDLDTSGDAPGGEAHISHRPN
jgi:hypothetical protein